MKYTTLWFYILNFPAILGTRYDMPFVFVNIQSLTNMNYVIYEAVEL